jgi:hypothetical protein
MWTMNEAWAQFHLPGLPGSRGGAAPCLLVSTDPEEIRGMGFGAEPGRADAPGRGGHPPGPAGGPPPPRGRPGSPGAPLGAGGGLRAGCLRPGRPAARQGGRSRSAGTGWWGSSTPWATSSSPPRSGALGRWGQRRSSPRPGTHPPRLRQDLGQARRGLPSGGRLGPVPGKARVCGRGGPLLRIAAWRGVSPLGQRGPGVPGPRPPAGEPGSGTPSPTPRPGWRWPPPSSASSTPGSAAGWHGTLRSPAGRWGGRREEA